MCLEPHMIMILRHNYALELRKITTSTHNYVFTTPRIYDFNS